MKITKVYCDVCKKEFDENYSHTMKWEGYWGSAWCHIIKPLEHCCRECENQILTEINDTFNSALIKLNPINQVKLVDNLNTYTGGNK